MDSNINDQSEFRMLEIKLIANEKIIGWAHSAKINEINDWKVWKVLRSIDEEIPIERKLRDQYIFGEFSSATFYKSHCKPFPRFFELQLYEDNKLSILLDQINLKYRSLKLEELISSF